MPCAMILWKIGAIGVLLVKVRGVHVARHHSEQLDVLAAQRAREADGLTDLDLGERAVLDEDPGLAHRIAAVMSSSCRAPRRLL
jgi:hypothetical protein